MKKVQLFLDVAVSQSDAACSLYLPHVVGFCFAELSILNLQYIYQKCLCDFLAGQLLRVLQCSLDIQYLHNSNAEE